MKRGVLAVLAVGGSLMSCALSAVAEEVTVEMHAISNAGVGAAIGTIKAMDTENGTVFQFALSQYLLPGPHGFHLHENASCDPATKDGAMQAGLAAGGHWDPENTGKHMGPAARGHKGDLPVIYVLVDDGGAIPYKGTLVAPYLKVADLKGRALVIHANGDNYADEPKPLGGGGARVACGLAAS